jgi:hypothetical protein
MRRRGAFRQKEEPAGHYLRLGAMVAAGQLVGPVAESLGEAAGEDQGRWGVDDGRDAPVVKPRAERIELQ